MNKTKGDNVVNNKYCENETWNRIANSLFSNGEAENDWAIHVLSSDLEKDKGIDGSNLGKILEEIPKSQIVDGVINAYRWSDCQPGCDTIINHISDDAKDKIIENTESVNANIRGNCLSVLYDIDKRKSIEMAQEMIRDESEFVRKCAEWILNNQE